MKRIGPILIIGLLTFIFGCSTTNRRYVPETKFQDILTNQTAMTPATLRELRKYGVKDDTHLRLIYIFYTNSIEKASALAKELKKKKYSAEYGLSVDKKDTYVITGWTDKMAMDEATVVGWAKQMCQIGDENDCQFDGFWGEIPTSPPGGSTGSPGSC